jgi:YfiH family protein
VSGSIDPLDAGLTDGVVGLFTTRAGGVSADRWSELNLGLHVEDEARRVLANRDLLAQHLGSSWVNFPQQIHGAAVLVVDAERAGRRQIVRGGARGVDALVTREPRTPIGVLAADCLPVLLADAGRSVVGVAHAGRPGLAAGILQATVAAMVDTGAHPADIAAVIGPGVCGLCYEVPEAMRDEVAAIVPGSSAVTRQGTPSLDLAAGAEGVLRDLGVGEVRRIGICTLEDPRFYSYRRDGQTGRFAGVVMLAGNV